MVADTTPRPRERRLAEVVREMKIKEADRLDATDRDGEMARMRLELLAEELQGVFDEAGGEEEGFDFSISTGPAPRLWIDAATHVSIGADGETFRVLRDGRGGRTVLNETADLDEAADAVTRYVATRSLERERLFDAAATPEGLQREPRPVPFGAPVAERAVPVRRPSRGGRLARALTWFILGMAAGAGLLFLAFGERLGFGNPVPAEYRFYEPYVERLAPAPGGVAVPGADLPGTGAGAQTEAGDGTTDGTTDGATVVDPGAPPPDPADPDVEVTTVPVETTRPAADDAADDTADDAADDTAN